MRRYFTMLCAVLLLAVLLVSCRSAADVAVSHSVAAVQGITGTWRYDGASVEAKGSNVFSRVAKPVAKSKIRKKLDKAYKKLKLNKSNTQLTLNADGTFALQLAGVGIRGKYEHDRSAGTLTLRWHGLPVTAHVTRDSKRLHLLFDTDKLLHLLQLASGITSSKTLESIALLAENYNDVRLGFAFKVSQ
ncbi:MAG: DUF4923 family protein [Muribaculaceae bacterium]|nr:DUF4923 family protein [Muribaculaceae bacterium]